MTFRNIKKAISKHFFISEKNKPFLEEGTLMLAPLVVPLVMAGISAATRLVGVGCRWFRTA